MRQIFRPKVYEIEGVSKCKFSRPWGEKSHKSKQILQNRNTENHFDTPTSEAALPFRGKALPPAPEATAEELPKHKPIKISSRILNFRI